ncbi:2OG-Fe(II) oxygenase [Pseudochryseolinea flava]|uniref:Prolyl 4-hydroxylase subunit alpha n=1 Tax=Pseudochryseolinea flava TaxID=2059302 RepID=A0A364Y8Q7_9BACT|nr:2OG-Fe(II) oxygenase [Pseudochryseolinea flava]RAW03496.1 prolyl 4-hydroxylase subunit alpha [Pseudochryseolinea flava]
MDNNISWKHVSRSLDENGYALLKGVLNESTCKEFIAMYNNDTLYRSVIKMERYRFGKGEYKYFNYPLPDALSTMREKFYHQLAPIANGWMKMLSIDTEFPTKHHMLIDLCKTNQQMRPTPLILRYEAGGYNTLHQDLYGEVYFPFQVVFALTQAGKDYTGGEFVLTEQVPRAQSKARVISLDQGDALIFTTNFRPAKSTRGYYRATMKHGISEVTGGVRYALGLIFHDAT